MSYTDDVFVSYAHLDNRPLYTGGQGWVTEFHRLLEIRLGELLGKKPRIYRDEKLAGNDEFGSELIDRLVSAPLFLSIMTPPYINSQWCARELQAFCDAMLKRPSAGNKLPLFKVLKTPVAPDKQPPAVQSCLGFKFYTEHPDTGVARELRLRVDGDLQTEFLEKLADLAHHLGNAIAALYETDPAVPPCDTMVYLAEPAADLRPTYDRIKRDLQEHGVTVVPNTELPDEITSLETCLDETLSGCRLSVHLVGKNYGVVPDGTQRSRIMVQAQHAGVHAAAGQLSRLIWIPAGLEVEDARQQKVIDELRADPQLQSGQGDLLEGSVEDLLTQIHAQLAASAEKSFVAPAAESEMPSVYVMCDERDVGDVAEVSDTLADHGCGVSLPEFGADEAEFREYNTGMLTHCDAALVYYGAANRNWLEQKLQELRRVPALGRKAPLRSTEILISAPRTWHGRFPNAHVVHSQAAPRGHLVDPLLADLGRL